MSDQPKVYKGKLKDFKPDPKNANRHTERGRWMVENSMSKRGYARPAFAANDGTVLGGNLSTMEVAGAIDLGDGDVLVIETDGRLPIIHKRTDIAPGSDEARLLALEDNRTAEISLDWSPDQLLADIAAGLDLGELFSTKELDAILADIRGGAGGTDSPPQTARKDELAREWGTAVGQVWQLGPHRLAIGDCTEAAVVEAVMQGERAGIMINDPPYGMNLDTDYSKITPKSIRHAEFERAKGKTRNHAFTAVIGDGKEYDPRPLLDMFSDVAEQFWWGADYYADKLPNRNAGSWLVWDKRQNEGDGDYNLDGMFGSTFEMCWSRTRHKREIIRVRFASLFGTETQDTKERLHPTQKAVQVIEFILGKYSEQNAIVFDGFCGSGTTIIACHNLNRQCRAVEIDPGYAAVTLQRFTDHTGIRPQLVTN